MCVSMMSTAPVAAPQATQKSDILPGHMLNVENRSGWSAFVGAAMPLQIASHSSPEDAAVRPLSFLQPSGRVRAPRIRSWTRSPGHWLDGICCGHREFVSIPLDTRTGQMAMLIRQWLNVLNAHISIRTLATPANLSTSGIHVKAP